MEKRYGLVYMGSKEKILHLIEYILHREQDRETFVDLFCGGLSVSAFVLKHTEMKVIANDLNKYVMAFYRELIFNQGRNFEKERYNWIDRKKFEMVRDFPNNYPDWYVGYVLNIWTFGCNQKDYLYAFDLEEHKKALHQAIVFKDFSYMDADPLFEGFKNYLERSVFWNINYQHNAEIRQVFMEKFNKFIEDSKGTPKYKQLRRLKMVVNLNLLEKVDAIYELIPHRDRLTLTSLDWKEVIRTKSEHLKTALVYCDPPYEDTKKYQFGHGFDYFGFWEWFRNSEYPIYVSSYKASPDIEPINFEEKIQLLDNGNFGENKPKKKVYENIYWNKKGGSVKTLLDLLFSK
jgi:site-specific DNA-adenine methylase